MIGQAERPQTSTPERNRPVREDPMGHAEATAEFGAAGAPVN